MLHSAPDITGSRAFIEIASANFFSSKNGEASLPDVDASVVEIFMSEMSNDAVSNKFRRSLLRLRSWRAPRQILELNEARGIGYAVRARHARLRLQK